MGCLDQGICDRLDTLQTSIATLQASIDSVLGYMVHIDVLFQVLMLAMVIVFIGRWFHRLILT